MEDCSLPPLTDEVSVLNDLNQMYFRQLVTVRVMVADESSQEMEEGVNVKGKVVVLVVRVRVTDEGALEIEEGVNVKGKVVRVSGEGKERLVMVGGREAQKQD